MPTIATSCGGMLGSSRNALPFLFFFFFFSLLQVVPEANPKRTILDAIHAVLTQKWFHGDIETADATYRIQNCPQVDTRRTAHTTRTAHAHGRG